MDMDMDTDTNATPSAHAQAFQRLEELRAELRCVYGALPAYQYEVRLQELDALAVALRKASRAMENTLSRIWRAELEAALWHLCHAAPR